MSNKVTVRKDDTALGLNERNLTSPAILANVVRPTLWGR
jgi:hypothetical protein